MYALEAIGTGSVIWDVFAAVLILAGVLYCIGWLKSH